MSTSGAEQNASLATKYIEQEGGWSGFIQNVILGGLAWQGYANVNEGIDSVGTVVVGPVRALGQGMIDLVESTIGGIVSVLDAGTQTTVYSFTDGVAAALGPLAQPTSVGVGMLSIGVFMWSLNRLEISPLSFLTSLNPRS